MNQWRAAAKDDGDHVHDTGTWHDEFAGAADDARAMLKTDPPYDDVWIERRMCYPPVRVMTEELRREAPDLAHLNERT